MKSYYSSDSVFHVKDTTFNSWLRCLHKLVKNDTKVPGEIRMTASPVSTSDGIGSHTLGSSTYAWQIHLEEHAPCFTNIHKLISLHLKFEVFFGKPGKSAWVRIFDLVSSCGIRECNRSAEEWCERECG